MAKRPEIILRLQEIASRPEVFVPWKRITIVRARFNTCADPPCVLYEWHDDDDPDVVGWSHAESRCSPHASAPLDETLWIAVHGENNRKVQSIIAARGATGLVDTIEIQTTFDETTRVIDGIQRMMTVIVPGINPQQQIQIQAVVDIRFGPGVVIVERG